MRSAIPFGVCLAIGGILLSRQTAHGGGVVAGCTELNLRAALKGGGSVTFACDGVISLAHTVTCHWPRRNHQWQWHGPGF